jgi:hypothetical protein
MTSRRLGVPIGTAISDSNVAVCVGTAVLLGTGVDVFVG